MGIVTLKTKNLLFHMFIEKPDVPPNPSKPLKTAEGFKCFYKSKFGNHRLIYSAEIDGVITNKTLKEPVDWKDVKFVELKTNVQLNYRNETNFFRNKMRDAWAQSYLTKIDQLICGFRDYNGIVHNLKSYKINELPNMSRV